ncbi:Interferon-induced GTP-binding protein [Seminavis robusta]|uniref:Interferon-induced GTP-binding protein n=1 Tax=Seminavis robusta TaxID=568900 RepID=A0A9N8EZ15_9STRA|nr:Interferon-induced GTP-binding protein [Seminavis robusta]|eukprot:Sro2999_g341910.1 Interferon-induced GTP-binding protein (755) ;mRNA; r:5660-7924
MTLTGNEQIRAFLDKLTASTNVSKYVELPMIAVMGETSSGKSSLLSSISGVELPSSSELTTRCPIMLQMNRAETRKAVINVQWKDIPEGKNKKDIEFKTLVVKDDDWEELPDSISNAQKHIIAASGKEVARDIVHVKVEGPLCEDLTLVDLPGIVRTRGVNESASIVEDIKALIDDYLTNSRCVILAVVPANVDFHNSQIMAEAQNVDPETSRTIPVITKPDLIDTGAEGDVVDLLLGRKTAKFQMGFHMVKGRGQAQLDKKLSIQESLQLEEAFFRNQMPWRQVTERNLFGTQLLRKKLGELQLGLIREKLPSIIDEIREKHDQAAEELASIGEIPQSDREKKMFYREVCDELLPCIAMMVQGTSLRSSTKRVRTSADSDTLPSQLHGKCDEYQRALKKAKFTHIATIEIGTEVVVSSGQGTVHGTVVGKNDTGDYFIDYQGRESHNKYEFVLKASCKDLKEGNAKGKTWRSNAGNVCISDGCGNYDELKAVSAKKVQRDPSWILPWMKKNRTDELPVFVNSAAFQAIVMMCIDGEYVKPSQALVKEAHQLLLEATDDALSSSKQLKRFPSLQVLIRRKLTDKAAALAKRAEEQVEHFIEKERTPYTQDHYLFENLTKKRFEPFLAQLKNALGLGPSSISSDTMSKKSIESIVDAVFDRNQRKSIDEHMAEDMQVTLDAYGKVALKRFIDGIPMECWDMVRKFPEATKRALFEVTDRDIERCLVVSSTVERRRDELKVMVDDLGAGIDVLETL